jgi:hypothetical protein
MILEIIKKRRSIRAFLDKAIFQEITDAFIEAPLAIVCCRRLRQKG